MHSTVLMAGMISNEDSHANANANAQIHTAALLGY